MFPRRSLILALVAGAALALAGARPSGQAPAATSAPFFFIQLSDPQFGFFTNDGDFSQETANFEFAVANINRLKPAFVVITGDLVNKAGDAAQMAEYERIKGSIAPGIPVYQMPGNHDVGNAPTPASVAAYRARFGPDHYDFRYQDLLGIVLDSTVIAAPDGVPAEYAEQQHWLDAELAAARTSGAKHVVIFQHHPWFLAKADESDGYYNIPRVRRDPLLAAFRAAGIATLVGGHYHQNAVASDGGVDMITTGPVGRPIGATAASGLRVFLVADAGITHRYFAFGEIPTTINAASGRLGPPAPGPGVAPGAGPAPAGRAGR